MQKNMMEKPEKRGRGRPKAFHDKTEQNTVQSLDRALNVLAYLSEHGGRTLTELAGETAQSPATLYRILSTFQLHDMAEFDEAEQVWHIGAGAFRVGAAFLRRTALVERARPVMRQLMLDTGETANLGLVNGDRVMFISQVETHESIRAFFPPGTQSPMHSSGIGKALLSWFNKERLGAWMNAQNLTQFTPNTLSDPHELLHDLALTRSRGYSFDDEERNLGMRCIAAPIFDGFGEPVAGISVSGPSARMTDARINEIAEHVSRAARDVIGAIGGRSPQA